MEEMYGTARFTARGGAARTFGTTDNQARECVSMEIPTNSAITMSVDVSASCYVMSRHGRNSMVCPQSYVDNEMRRNRW
jgi:hypothetical protein